MISVCENQSLHRNASGEVMPREQMENVPDSTQISDAALLAILLKTGAPGLNVMDLSARILEAFGSLKNLVSGDWRFLEARIEDWNNAHPERPIKGVGHVKCLELAAAFEIARRWDRLPPETIKTIHVDSPRKAYDAFRSVLIPGDEKEDLLVLLLNTKNRPLCEPIKIARGTQNYIGTYAKDVYKEALRWGAHAVMIAHTHPSGDPTPSEDDVAFTQELIDVGRIAQIPLLDHLVIGAMGSVNGRGYISLREYTNLEWQTPGGCLVSGCQWVVGAGKRGDCLRDEETTDRQVCAKCGIIKSKQKFIESMIKPTELNESVTKGSAPSI